jgi:hypothetical protein
MSIVSRTDEGRDKRSGRLSVATGDGWSPGHVVSIRVSPSVCPANSNKPVCHQLSQTIWLEGGQDGELSSQCGQTRQLGLFDLRVVIVTCIVIKLHDDIVINLTEQMSEFLAELYKIPPVTRSASLIVFTYPTNTITRFLCASTLAVSILVMMHLVHPYKVLYMWRMVFDRWQVCVGVF